MHIVTTAAELHPRLASAGTVAFVPTMGNLHQGHLQLMRIAREHGIVISPEARRRMLDDLTIQYYYEGAYVASRRTPQGVEILAVGWDEAHKYRQDHPPETRKDVRIGTV